MPHARDDTRRHAIHPSALDAPRCVTVTTGCRLHFGLLADGGRTGCQSVPRGTAAGRQFGGAGVMLDSPGVELVLERADRWGIAGAEPGRSRVEQFVARYGEHCGARRPAPCRVELRREIPPHAGLGSGTQLGLAVARGLAALGGEPDLPATELARRVGRGARSAIGVHGFEHGGFIVDGGKSEADAIGGLAARLVFPSEWRFVLVTPPDQPGLSGRAEKAAFERLPPPPGAQAAALRRLVFEELLPAVAAADFDRCGEALYALNRGVGESFAAIQGGVFASERMAALAERLRAAGLRGVGQTSWGPTLFALVLSQHDAERLRTEAEAHECCRGCRMIIAAPRSEPARLDLTIDGQGPVA